MLQFAYGFRRYYRRISFLISGSITSAACTGTGMGVRRLFGPLLKETQETWVSIPASKKMMNQFFDPGKDFICTLPFFT